MPLWSVDLTVRRSFKACKKRQRFFWRHQLLWYQLKFCANTPEKKSTACTRHRYERRWVSHIQGVSPAPSASAPISAVPGNSPSEAPAATASAYLDAAAASVTPAAALDDPTPTSNTAAAALGDPTPTASTAATASVDVASAAEPAAPPAAADAS